MIFSHTLAQVLNGKKQQTRRLVKENEVFDSAKQAIVKVNTRTMYKVGRTYAVQPNRGKKAVARIEITAIRKEAIRLISDLDAVEEGFQSRDKFLEAWYSIHGHNADLDRIVWVIEFKLESIIAEQLEEFIDAQNTKNKGPNHSQDLPSAIKKISGNSLYCWDNRGRGMGPIIVTYHLSLNTRNINGLRLNFSNEVQRTISAKKAAIL